MRNRPSPRAGQRAINKANGSEWFIYDVAVSKPYTTVVFLLEDSKGIENLEDQMTMAFEGDSFWNE